MNAEAKSSDWKVEKGVTLTDCPTALDVISVDGEPVPVIMRNPGDLHPAPRLIPYDRYIDPKFVDLEVEHIWKKQWQVACRAEDIPNVGDRIAYDIVDNSYLIVRTGENEFKAFYNSCRHRGRKLCDDHGQGASIRCGFHGWEYGLDGKLQWVPYEQDFPHVDIKRHGLVPVRTATWGGNVFINPDPAAPPLEAALGPLIEHFKTYPTAERYTTAILLIDVGCNWKAGQEAFMEGYHVLESHADAMPMVNSVSTQIDCWSEGLGYVSRLFTPAVTTDTWIEGQVSPRECLELFCEAYSLPAPPEDRGLDVEDGRKYVAEMRRDRLVESTGKDWSGEKTSYFVDQVKYFMFPNLHPFWGEGTPRWFTFKPLGRDPNVSRMEIRSLAPYPASGETPPPAKVYHVGVGERLGAKFPEFGRSAHLLDQDLDNMCAVQLGFKAAAPGADHLTLSKYHEAKIRRFHELYDHILGLDTDD